MSCRRRSPSPANAGRGHGAALLGGAGEPSIEAFVLDSPFSDLSRLLKENIARLTHLPGGPVVAALDLLLRSRSGHRLAEASPLAILSALEPRPLFFIPAGAAAVTGVHPSPRLSDNSAGR